MAKKRERGHAGAAAVRLGRRQDDIAPKQRSRRDRGANHIDQLHFQSAVAIARQIRDRKISAVDALEHFLARVAKYNPTINAIIWLDADRARARAKTADVALAKGEI